MNLLHHILLRWAWLLLGIWTGGGLAVLSYYSHHGKHSISRAYAHIGEFLFDRASPSPMGAGFEIGSDRVPLSAPTIQITESPAAVRSSVARPIDRLFVRGLVSVVIPTYNRGHLLEKAIDSVLAQTYQPVEVIVVDDGSTDDTGALVGRYDSRVRYFRQENAGVSAARNRGLRETKGEFIGLLDSDDEWLPWKLELQVAALRRFSELGMVWTDMAAVDDRGTEVAKAYLRTMYSAYSRVNLPEKMQQRGRISDLKVANLSGMESRRVFSGDIFPYMLIGNLVHTSTVLLRRDRVRAVGGFDESLRVSGEDYEFHVKTCFNGAVGFLDVSSIRYRVGANDQLTAQRFMLQVARNNLTTVVRWLERGGTRLDVLGKAQIRSTLANAHGWLGREEFEAGNRTLARRHLGKSLRFGARSARTMALIALSLAPPSVASRLTALRENLRRG